MQELQTITIKEYLIRKGIAFRESGKELITHCLFNGCDSDSKGTEAHLYFDAETGQYNCKKCGEKGNLITLAKHFGDGIQEIALNPLPSTEKQRKSVKFDAVFSSDLVRAKRTAELIAADRKLAVNTHRLLRERFFGHWEGGHENIFYEENKQLFELQKKLTEQQKLDFKYSIFSMME